MFSASIITVHGRSVCGAFLTGLIAKNGSLVLWRVSFDVSDRAVSRSLHLTRVRLIIKYVLLTNDSDTSASTTTNIHIKIF